jgi:hypothetical protein
MKYFLKIFLFVSLFSLSCALAFAQDTGGAKGKVRTTRNVAIDGVKVTARRDGKDVKTATTDKNGAFEMSGLEPGDYNFVFDKEGFNSGVFYNVEIKKNKIRDLGSRLVLRPDEGTQVIIRGIVFDKNGRSVRGANIEIQKKQADGTYLTVKTTTSSYGVEPLATGEFVFRFPEQGSTEFRVVATAQGTTATKEISVHSAAVYRLALTLNLEQQ